VSQLNERRAGNVTTYHSFVNSTSNIQIDRNLIKLNHLKKVFHSILANLERRKEPSFDCPLCGYSGVFASLNSTSGRRKYAVCPKCGALERHRLQKLVFESVMEKFDRSKLDLLHIAPEECHQIMFKGIGNYVTADLTRSDVDINFDLQKKAPFPNCAFDVVIASHVLEHIPDDNRALAELRRIIKPGGIAILPVPIVSQYTIEYPQPNDSESGHVRAPGFDYFTRYRNYFDRIEEFSSESFPEIYQLYIYEDRTIYPTSESPLRTPMPGERHIDIVPVCFT